MPRPAPATPVLTGQKAWGVLVTRPEPGLSETMAAVRALGWEPFAAPSLAVTPLPVPRQSGVAAVLVTSGQAVPALAQAVAPDTPVLAVGDTTAHRARAAGCLRVESADGDANALAALVLARLSPADGTLLLMSGAGQGLELAATLRRAGFTVRRRVAYAARPVRHLPSLAHAALKRGEIRAVLVFSAQSARSTCRALQQARCDVTGLAGIAISEKSRHILEYYGFIDTRASVRPDAAAMLDLLKSIGNGFEKNDHDDTAAAPKSLNHNPGSS